MKSHTFIKPCTISLSILMQRKMPRNKSSSKLYIPKSSESQRNLWQSSENLENNQPYSMYFYYCEKICSIELSLLQENFLPQGPGKEHFLNILLICLSFPLINPKYSVHSSCIKVITYFKKRKKNEIPVRFLVSRIFFGGWLYKALGK